MGLSGLMYMQGNVVQSFLRNVGGLLHSPRFGQSALHT
jgi:hypothetical protein